MIKRENVHLRIFLFYSKPYKRRFDGVFWFFREIFFWKRKNLDSGTNSKFIAYTFLNNSHDET